MLLSSHYIKDPKYWQLKNVDEIKELVSKKWKLWISENHSQHQQTSLVIMGCISAKTWRRQSSVEKTAPELFLFHDTNLRPFQGNS